jgi:formylmethanofuran dehydrogenase subunit E
MWGYKMKEDTGKFGFNKRDWKVVPRTEIYRENYDKIFRKIFCNICGLQCYDAYGNLNSEEYICINCVDRFFNETVKKGEKT